MKCFAVQSGWSDASEGRVDSKQAKTAAHALGWHVITLIPGRCLGREGAVVCGVMLCLNTSTRVEVDDAVSLLFGGESEATGILVDVDIISREAEPHDAVPYIAVFCKSCQYVSLGQLTVDLIDYSPQWLIIACSD